MPLSKVYQVHRPRTSWWLKQGRAFLIALAGERARMHKLPVTGLVMLEGSGKMSRPNQRRLPAPEVSE